MHGVVAGFHVDSCRGHPVPIFGRGWFVLIAGSRGVAHPRNRQYPPTISPRNAQLAFGVPSAWGAPEFGRPVCQRLGPQLVVVRDSHVRRGAEPERYLACWRVSMLWKSIFASPTPSTRQALVEKLNGCSLRMVRYFGASARQGMVTVQMRIGGGGGGDMGQPKGP